MSYWDNDYENRVWGRPFYDDDDRAWRRFDESEDFERRAGALDERWGYGSRLRAGRIRGRGRDTYRVPEDEYLDDYNAPDYWIYAEEWGQPGPYSGIGPKGYQRSDERILDDIHLRLTQNGQIDASEIQVSVDDGEVTLKGTVEDRRMKRMVEANVDMIPGVIDVHNELQLRHKGDEAARRRAREMADKFPGGPANNGPAARRIR